MWCKGVVGTGSDILQRMNAWQRRGAAVLEVLGIFLVGGLLMSQLIRLSGIAVKNPLAELSVNTTGSGLIAAARQLFVLLIFQYAGYFLLIIPIGWWHRHRGVSAYGLTKASHTWITLLLAGLGTTAVVTGASSGIGKVYAERLAKKGYDLFLVARRGDRLETLAKELTQQFGVQVKTQTADLGDSVQLEAVAKALSGNDQVTLLVNNAGTSFVGTLDGATVDQLNTLVNINIVALTRLSMAVLPGLKSRNQGVIVNIGSVLGFDGYPYAPIYGATKAFVQNLTKALQAELATTNVVIQLVAPASTVSEIWDVQGFPLSNIDPNLVMSTEDMVDAALVGLERKEKVTAPSVQDAATVTRYFEAASALFGASQQTGKPAPRYSNQ